MKGVLPMEHDPPSLRDEVIAHFTKTVGPVAPAAQIEIVPTTDPPISIHVIPAGPGREHVTLFTTGMSDRPMNVPPGDKASAYAEIFLQLPADWPTDPATMMGPDTIWPMFWLRKMAGNTHASSECLLGPATIFAASEPPEPLWDGTPFTSFLLLAREQIAGSDGRTVQLFHAFPLHTDERALEIQHGLPALMRALDRAGTPFVVDLNRPSVAGEARIHRARGCAVGIVLAAGLLAMLATLVAWIWTPGMGWWALSILGGMVAIVLAEMALSPPTPEATPPGAPPKPHRRAVAWLGKIGQGCLAASVALMVAGIWAPEVGWWSLVPLGGAFATLAIVAIRHMAGAHQDGDSTESVWVRVLAPLSTLLLAAAVVALIAWIWMPGMGWWALAGMGGCLLSFLLMTVLAPRRPGAMPGAMLATGLVVLLLFFGLLGALVAWAWVPGMGWWALGLSVALIAALIVLGLVSPPDDKGK